MVAMRITPQHINKFKEIKRLFFSRTEVPKPNYWKGWSNNAIWLQLIRQVIVVGGSGPADEFNNRSALKKIVSYNALSKLENEKEIKRLINSVLCEIGARYASKNITKCRKTQALAHNLKILKGFRGGPKGLLKKVAGFTGRNETRRKIKYFMKIFHFVKSKSSRDFLMALGLIKDAIALDIRVQNILKKVGVRVPKGLVGNSEIYDEAEKELLNRLCKPLRLSGVQFDRMIYQNYDKIKKWVERN